MSAYNCSPVTGGCDESFASLDGFDSHLIPHMNRPADCQNKAWLKANGYALNKFGEWFHVEKAAGVSARFHKAQTRARSGSLADLGAGQVKSLTRPQKATRRPLPHPGSKSHTSPEEA